MCMAVHMLIKTASVLTTETVNTHVSKAAFPRIYWKKKLNLILMSQDMILFDKTAHVTGEILVMSFK